MRVNKDLFNLKTMFWANDLVDNSPLLSFNKSILGQQKVKSDMELLQFLGIMVSVFGSTAVCYIYFHKDMKEIIESVREEIKEIRTEVKDVRNEVKESDKRWFMLLEKMHMLDKDVDKLKAKN